MMSSRHAVNGLLVLMIVITGTRLWSGRWEPSAAVVGPPLKVGGSLRLAVPEGLVGDRRVWVFVSTTCPACDASAMLYAELVNRAALEGNVAIVFVAAEDADSVRLWLSARGVRTDSVKISRVTDLARLGVYMVPTIAITNGAGVITDLAERLLGSEAQHDLLTRVSNPSSKTPLNTVFRPPEVPVGRIDGLRSRGAHIVDVRSREEYEADHKAGTVNIPSDELTARAAVELTAGRTVVIDCEHVNPVVCRAAALWLSEGGFADVRVAVRR
jgi:rhodanese-related sulfurtransferase